MPAGDGLRGFGATAGRQCLAALSLGGHARGHDHVADEEVFAFLDHLAGVQARAFQADWNATMKPPPSLFTSKQGERVMAGGWSAVSAPARVRGTGGRTLGTRLVKREEQS